MVPVRLPKSFLLAMKETILKDNKLIPVVHKDSKPTDLSSGSHKKEAAFTTDGKPGKLSVASGGQVPETQNYEFVEENVPNKDVGSVVKVDSKGDEILPKLKEKVVKGQREGNNVNPDFGEACEIAEINDLVPEDKQKEANLIEINVIESSGKVRSPYVDYELEKKQLLSSDAKESSGRKSTEVGLSKNGKEKIDSKKVSRERSTEENRTAEKLEGSYHQIHSDLKILDSSVMEGTDDKQFLQEKNLNSLKALEKPNLSHEVNVGESPADRNLRTDGNADSEQNQESNRVAQSEDVENHISVTGFKETKDFEIDCKYDEALLESNASKLAQEETKKSDLNAGDKAEKILARDSIDGNFQLFDNKAMKAVVTPKLSELKEIVKDTMGERKMREGVEESIPESPLLSPVEESAERRATKNDSNDSKISEATNSKESSSKKRARSGSGQHSSRTQSLLKGFFEALDRRKREQSESKQAANAGKDDKKSTGVLRKKSIGSSGASDDKETLVGVIEYRERQKNETKEVLSGLITASNDVAELKVERSNETLASKKSSALFDHNQDTTAITAKISENDLLENERVVTGETRDAPFIEGEGKEDDVINRSKEEALVKIDEDSPNSVKYFNGLQIKAKESLGNELHQENVTKQTLNIPHDVERLAVDGTDGLESSRLRSEAKTGLGEPKSADSKIGNHDTVDDANNKMIPFDSPQETKGLDDTLAKRIDRIFTMENVQVDVKTSDSYIPFVVGTSENVRKAKLVRDASSQVMHSDNEPEDIRSVPSGMVVKITLTRTNEKEKIKEEVSNESQANTEVAGSKCDKDRDVGNTQRYTLATNRPDVNDAMSGLDSRALQRYLHPIEADIVSNEGQTNTEVTGSQCDKDHAMENTEDNTLTTNRPDFYDAMSGLHSRVSQRDLQPIEVEKVSTEDQKSIGMTGSESDKDRIAENTKDKTVATDRRHVYDAMAVLDCVVNKKDLHSIEGEYKTKDVMQGLTNFEKSQERFSTYVVDRTSTSLKIGSNLPVDAKKHLRYTESLDGDENTCHGNDRLGLKSSEVQTEAETRNIDKLANERVLSAKSVPKNPCGNSELENSNSKSQHSSSKDDQGVYANNKQSQTTYSNERPVVGIKSESTDDSRLGVDRGSDVPLKIDERLEAVKRFSLAQKLASGSQTGDVAKNISEGDSRGKQEPDIVPRPPRGRARGRPVSGR